MLVSYLMARLKSKISQGFEAEAKMVAPPGAAKLHLAFLAFRTRIQLGGPRGGTQSLQFGWFARVLDASKPCSDGG